MNDERINLSLAKNQNKLAQVLSRYCNASDLDMIDFSHLHYKNKELSKKRCEKLEYYNESVGEFKFTITRILDSSQTPPDYYMEIFIQRGENFSTTLKCLFDVDIFIHLNTVVAKALNQINYDDISSTNLINEGRCIELFCKDIIDSGLLKDERELEDATTEVLKIDRMKLLAKEDNEYIYAVKTINFKEIIIDNIRLGTICFSVLDCLGGTLKYVFIPKSRAGLGYLAMISNTLYSMLKNKKKSIATATHHI